MKYKIIDKSHPFFGYVFDREKIKISGENRVWDLDSFGRSYPETSCSKIEESVNGI